MILWGELFRSALLGSSLFRFKPRCLLRKPWFTAHNSPHSGAASQTSLACLHLLSSPSLILGFLLPSQVHWVLYWPNLLPLHPPQILGGKARRTPRGGRFGKDTNYKLSHQTGTDRMTRPGLPLSKQPMTEGPLQRPA